MTAKEIDFLSSREMLGFTLPVMHTKGGNWYVDFYAHDPVSGRMKRKKYMLNKFKTDRKKRMMGSLLIHNITAKLTAGWNPWVNVDKSRQFTEIPTIISRYRDYVKAMTRKRVITLFSSLFALDDMSVFNYLTLIICLYRKKVLILHTDN